MIVKCEICKARFDDEWRTTICPHETFPANDGRNNSAHNPAAFLEPVVQPKAPVACKICPLCTKEDGHAGYCSKLDGSPSSLQPEAPLKQLELIRRMQATTIELCAAWMVIHLHGAGGESKESSYKAQFAMKRYVSRVCGLTEKDFEREEENGTKETKTKKISDVGFCDGDGKPFRVTD